MTHVEDYLLETVRVANTVSHTTIDELIDELFDLKQRRGTLYLAGLGGSAANASHAANDFRKLCHMKVVCLTDNVAELTARANDEGWRHCFDLGHAEERDALLVLSVGGGAEGVSQPLVELIDLAKEMEMTVLGICGRDGGHLKRVGDCVLVVPVVEASRVTPHTEGWQSVVLHCIVSHPDLQSGATKW